MRKITIAVTGLNNTDNPGPGIPVIRSIRESEEFDVRIVGLAYENLEPGIYMDGMVDKTYLFPYPSSGKDAVWQRIMEIHAKENIDIIIPNFDAELQTFMLLEEDLKSKGISMFIPTRHQFDERQKNVLNKYGEKYGITVPKSIEITSLSEIKRVEKEFDFPVVVKGKFYDAHIANSPEQVTAWFSDIAGKWGVPVIIQEFVKGTEVNVVAVGDGKGNTVGAVPMRKQYVTDKGKAWGGIVINDNKLLSICKDIITKTDWKGGMELEMILGKNGEYYLIEINPRLPAWVYLAVGAGQNLPEMVVKLALGESVELLSEYKQGTMFIRYSQDMIGNISDFEQLNITGEL
jgi:carbamoyl-phosphate synthase large subunit